MTFISNKYTKWYYQIIDRAQKRASTRQTAKLLFEYPERHHIIPTSMNGTNNLENLAFLTPREHFIFPLDTY